MRNYIISAALAAFMATAAAGSAQADHWHGGPRYAGYGYHQPYWRPGTVVVAGAYPSYYYPAAYYPMPVAPAPVVVAPPVGLSLGLFLR